MSPDRLFVTTAGPHAWAVSHTAVLPPVRRKVKMPPRMLLILVRKVQSVTGNYPQAEDECPISARDGYPLYTGAAARGSAAFFLSAPIGLLA